MQSHKFPYLAYVLSCPTRYKLSSLIRNAFFSIIIKTLFYWKIAVHFHIRNNLLGIVLPYSELPTQNDVVLIESIVNLSKGDGITLWRATFKKVLARVRHMSRYFVYIKQIVYDGKPRQKS